MSASLAVGLNCPVSIELIVLRDTPTISASCVCDNFNSVRASFSRFFNIILMGTPDRVPIFASFSSVIQRMYGSSYRDLYYDFDKAGQASLDFYRDHPLCDIAMAPSCVSGRVNELAGSTMID